MPPPVVGPDFQTQEEARKVGRFGLVMTASLISFLLLILVVGGIYSVAMGCLGACSAGIGGRPTSPPPSNLSLPYVGPLIAGIVVFWVILTIVIIVILKRRRR